MITPLTETQKKLIVTNIVNACKNIGKLNGTGYKFIYLASGFIAHYNIDGFKDFYTDYPLREDIKKNWKQNMWENFRPGDENYDYYMSKADVYKRILAKI